MTSTNLTRLCKRAGNPNIGVDILDEIALEGLDGLTINTLFWRLSHRANFHFTVDEFSKKYIWNILLNLQDINFYLLPAERNETKLICLQYDQKINLGIAERELYPFSPISNSLDFGSCESYQTRKDISAIVQTKGLDECLLTFGTKLVIVANKSQRLKALSLNQVFPDFSDLAAKPSYFCILEAIGRARGNGLNTFGAGSARLFELDASQIFYQVAFLVKRRLVRKVQRSGNQTLVLTRFFDEEKHVQYDDMLLKLFITESKKYPNMAITFAQVGSIVPSFQNKRRRFQFFNSEAVKKHFKDAWISIPYTDKAADNVDDEAKGGHMKKVRGYQLFNEEVEDTTYENDSLNDNAEDDGVRNDRSEANLELHTPFSLQLYREILKAGPSGISSSQLLKKLDVTRKGLETAVKKLVKNGVITSFPVHSGRQKVAWYKISDKELQKDLVQSLQAQLIKNCGEAAAPIPTPSCEEAEVIEEAKDVIANNATQCSRKLFRMGLILRAIKTHRALPRYHLMGKIRAEEKELGYKDEISGRTMKSLLDQLVNDGVIQVLSKDKTDYYSDLDFTADSLNNEKEPVLPPKTLTVDEHVNQLLLESERTVKELIVTTTERIKTSIFVNQSPKFFRLSILHDLIFYLVRGYMGDMQQSQEDLLDQLESSCPLDASLREQLPRLYSDHLSSYMFIPPLSPGHALAPGWCSFAEILLNTPLAVYQGLAGLPKNNEEIEKYMSHPILRNLPVSHLPTSVRSLLFSVNPIYRILIDVKRLCYMGLIRFGSKFQCKKVYLRPLYVNTRALILDTRTSSPNYFHVDKNRKYKAIPYLFRNTLDVKNYWRELFTICLETKLGVERKARHKSKKVKMRESEKAELNKCCEEVTHKEAVAGDTGFLPGDQLGAGGLDTVMFSFVRSNWINTAKKKSVAPKPIPLSHVRKRINKTPPKAVKAKKKKRTQEDDDDEIEKKQSKTQRVHWSKEEDNIIMLCKIAMNFLCPIPKSYITIPVSNVRTVLQKYAKIDITVKNLGAVSRRINTVRKVHRNAIAGFVKMLQRMPELKQFIEKCPPKEVADVKRDSPELPQLKSKLYAVFLELVYWLIDKYVENGMVLALQELVIPDTIEDFKNEYVLAEEKQYVLSEQKIKEDSIRAVLMSSLATSTDKTSQASQLFDIYRQCSEKLLRTAIQRLHRQHIITYRKSIRNNVRRATSSPYQFSQRFGYLLNTKYSQPTYHEAYRELNLLLCCPAGSYMEVNLSRCGPASFVLGGLGYASFRTSVPEQFVVLDTEMVSKTEWTKIMNRYEELLQHSDPLSVVREGKGQKRPLMANDSDSESEEKKMFLGEKLFDNEMSDDSFSLSQQSENRMNIASNANRSLSQESLFDIQSEASTTQTEELFGIEAASKAGISLSQESLFDIQSEPSSSQTSIGALSKSSISQTENLNHHSSVSTSTCPMEENLNRIHLSSEAKTNNFQKNATSNRIHPGGEPSTSQRLESVTTNRTGPDAPIGFRSARVALFLLREIATAELCPTHRTFRKPVDVFVVNTSKVEIAPGPHLTRDFGCSVKTPKEILNSVMARANIVNATEDGIELKNLLSNVAPEEAKKIVALARIIEKRGAAGISLVEARNHCRNAAEIVKRLEEANLICRLGLSEIQLVSRKFASVWLVNSYRITRLTREKMKQSELSMSDVKNPSVLSQKLMDAQLVASNSLSLTPDQNKVDRPIPVQILMRPWLRVDGSINRRVFDRLLGSVLGYIMLNPGGLASLVTAKFSPALTPAWTLELIDVLEDLGCLTRKAIHLKKPTLFSSTTLKISDKLTGLELADELICEPKIDAIINLGKFIGNKSYSKDILSNSSIKIPEGVC